MSVCAPPAPRKPPLYAPETPVVKSKTEGSVTLSWSPPQPADRPVPINGYLVEKRRLGAYAWSRCHEAEWVAASELTVAGVAQEGDYQFRVSAVNNFGQSPYLEFPGTIHLSKWGWFCLLLSSECHPVPDSSPASYLRLGSPHRSLYWGWGTKVLMLWEPSFGRSGGGPLDSSQCCGS